MVNTIRKLFTPPVFDDDEKSRSAFYIHWVALISVFALFAFFLARIVLGNPPFGFSNIILLVLTGVITVVWVLTRAGAVRLAGYIHIGTIWAASTLLALTGSGVRGTGFTSYFVVMLLAGLLLGVWPAVGIAVISVISGFGLAYAETTGLITYTPGAAYEVAAEATFLFTFSTLFMVLTINSLQNALKRAKANAIDLEVSNKELTDLRDALEIRVQERTSALEKRATQLQTVSNVARSIASVQDINKLLFDITRLISTQFNFYHVGIFFLDENREYAVLRAANSEGGERMLKRQHKLKLDSNSIVGYVTSREEPRIALDVGSDAVYFDNPDLPATRSEMALPLRLGGQVIGALDVQSTQANAFSEEDIATLSILADQVAIAIENARLFSESREALVASQGTFDKYVKQEWSSFTKQARQTGFVYDGKRVTPWDGSKQSEQKRNIVQTGRLSLEKVSPTIAIPIKLRGQTIGMIDVRSKSGQHEWTPDEITLLEAAAERAALALENARLVESAQRRASRERAIGEISSKIGTFSDMNAILQTAVEELGRKIGGATEVTIELGEDHDKGNS
jgi:GAF domain-containing protein